MSRGYCGSGGTCVDRVWLRVRKIVNVDTRADDGVDDAFIDPDDFCDHSSEAGGVF